MNKVNFYILLLLKEKGKKDYKEISRQARTALYYWEKESHYQNLRIIEGEENNHQKWYALSGSLGSNSVIIRHYKMRIILEVGKKYDNNNLADLFSEAREERDTLESELSLSDLIDKIKGQSNIAGVFKYSLIEIVKDYKPKDFKSFGQEPITTFFYEVPDHKKLKENNRSRKIFSLTIPKTIIRLSRLSVITSRMSDFMRMEIINILYDTCLYDQRKKDIGKPDDETFQSMKEHLGKILFDIESTSSNAEISRTLNILSILMSLGAIASILAIMTFMPWLIKQETAQAMNNFKTFLGLILLISAGYFAGVFLVKK